MDSRLDLKKKINGLMTPFVRWWFLFNHSKWRNTYSNEN